MAQEEQLSPALESKVAELIHMIEVEGVSNPDDGGVEVDVISPNIRRIIKVLENYEKEAKALGTNEQKNVENIASVDIHEPKTEATTKAPQEPRVAWKQPPAPEQPPADPWADILNPESSDEQDLNKSIAPSETKVKTAPAATAGKDQPSARKSSPSAVKAPTPVESIDPRGPHPAERNSTKPISQNTVPDRPSLPAPEPAPDSSVPEPKGRVSTPQPGGVLAYSEDPEAKRKAVAKPVEAIKKSTHLKNAKANVVYEEVVEIDGVKDLKILDLGEAGLGFDEAKRLLKGTPINSGDFVLRFQGLLGDKPCEITVNLAVIPDPKSLWVSKDSDQNDRFWKPDEEFLQIDGDLLCVAASKRGRSHAQEGSFRDDHFGLSENGRDGWHIAVVADGAGSAKCSRRGSEVAVKSVLGNLTKLLERHVTPMLTKQALSRLRENPEDAFKIKKSLYDSVVTAAFDAAKAIEEEAKSESEKASAFLTTLIVVVVRKIPEGWFIAGFSIGDGGAAVFDIEDESLTTLMQPDSGEFAGQTRFLLSSEFDRTDRTFDRIFFDIRKKFTAIALMTDGISDPKFPTDSVFADPAMWVKFWNEDIAEAVVFTRENHSIEQQFMDWLDFWSPGNHDDRTLAILVP